MKRLTAFDSLSAVGEPLVLRALFERRWLLLARQPLAGAAVSFATDGGRPLGSAETDASGFATLRIPVPFEATSFLAEHPGGSRARGGVYRFDRDDPILVCDLDLTLSDATPLRFWVSPVGAVAPFEGASKVLRSLAHRFRIVYLTARRDLFLDKTREWLRLNLIPPGPILSRPWSFLPIPSERFKREALADLKGRFPRLAVGIGDRPHDARAYLAHGMKAFLLRPRGRVPEGAVPCDSWNEILERCA